MLTNTLTPNQNLLQKLPNHLHQPDKTNNKTQTKNTTHETQTKTCLTKSNTSKQQPYRYQQPQQQHKPPQTSHKQSTSLDAIILQKNNHTDTNNLQHNPALSKTIPHFKTTITQIPTTTTTQPRIPIIRKPH